MSMLDHLEFPPTRAYDKTCLMRTHLELFYAAKAIAKTSGTDFSDLARRALRAYLPVAYEALSEREKTRAEMLFSQLMSSGKMVDLPQAQGDDNAEERFWEAMAEEEE